MTCPMQVIYGYPHLKTGSIIAYECMRAYLRFSVHLPLAPIVEEGLCRLVALLWLEGVHTGTFDIPNRYYCDMENMHAYD